VHCLVAGCFAVIVATRAGSRGFEPPFLGFPLIKVRGKRERLGMFVVEARSSVQGLPKWVLESCTGPSSNSQFPRPLSTHTTNLFAAIARPLTFALFSAWLDWNLATIRVNLFDFHPLPTPLLDCCFLYCLPRVPASLL
jgi:hypothetical protein